MVATALLVRSGNTAQQQGIILQLMSGRNNLCSPQRTVRATASNLRGILFTFLMRELSELLKDVSLAYA
jgi:hypothetical protein